tara:strand:+ start:192 stop:836 length:645 start_codon:yes stop_codon:yes gene_type:complete
MDEETVIINTNTRNEKIKNFFAKNKSYLIVAFSIIIIFLITIFFIIEFKKDEKINISDKFNSSINAFERGNSQESLNGLIDIINRKDPTYSPLSLYFIVDNELIEERSRINAFFDILINETSLEKEIKYLIIYKKGLFNADRSNEVSLMNILKPLINSESIWKSHALFLVAEFFYSKNEKQKAREFYEKIISLENANSNIKINSQKRLNRDISD